MAARKKKAATAKKPRAAVPAHRHICRCRHEWVCKVRSPKKCFEAARANKQDPLCILCFHLEMAARCASLRGLNLADALRSMWPLNLSENAGEDEGSEEDE